MMANGADRGPEQRRGEGRWPDNVGILALELYTPATRVDQAELERYDGASSGKYTVGLGQSSMGFCGDQEDIHSLCLTAVQRLVERNGLSYADIGRLEVGTETVVDKSKSVKTVLMQLFAAAGNTSVEGIDTTNACYGGTAALFNAVSWVESSAWDGRFAVVVAADIAVYASGNARPTGGAGAVAMLVGPSAPLYLERGLRGVHMEHAYDFYKPDLSSEYPVVDGKLSIQCYLRALDHCYKRFRERYLKYSGDKQAFSLAKADWFAFHSPYTKLVQKSFARLLLNDFLSEEAPDTSEKGMYAGLSTFLGRKLEDTVFDRDVEKAFMNASEGAFRSKVAPTLVVAKEVGNMYTASLYGGFVSLLAQRSASELAGTRLMAFSYGSGLASTLYALRFSSDPAHLERLIGNVSEVPAMLESRRAVPPAEFEQTLKLREETNHLAPYRPVGGRGTLHPGTYFLTEVDDKHRRKYQRVPPKPDKTGLSPLAIFNGSKELSDVPHD